MQIEELAGQEIDYFEYFFQDELRGVEQSADEPTLQSLKDLMKQINLLRNIYLKKHKKIAKLELGILLRQISG